MDPCPFGTHPKISQYISFTYDPSGFKTAASAVGLGASELVQSPLSVVDSTDSEARLSEFQL